MNIRGSFHRSLIRAAAVLREGAATIKGVDGRLFAALCAAGIAACGIGSAVNSVAEDKVKCYSIEADGETVVSLASYALASDAAKRFTKGYTEEENVIYSNLEISEDFAPIDGVSSVGEALEILSESEEVVVTYKVDNVTEIDIPYATRVIEDNSLKKGTEIVEQEGECGKCVREVTSYYENGVETTSLAPFAKVEKAAVDRVVRVGTLTMAGLDENGIACPVRGSLTSSFGERWGRKHTGTDIGAPIGTKVCLPAAGVVIFAGEKSGYGNYVMVDHGKGYVTAYAHLSEISVSEGDALEEGDLVGKVGVTGNVTGPHLHFEIIKDGEFVDPETLMSVDK